MARLCVSGQDEYSNEKKIPQEGAVILNNNKRPRQLAEEHWDWLQSILNKQREMEKKLFIDAFVHGFGHGEEKKETYAYKARKREDIK